MPHRLPHRVDSQAPGEAGGGYPLGTAAIADHNGVPDPQQVDAGLSVKFRGYTLARQAFT